MLKFNDDGDIEKLEKVLLNLGKEALEKTLVDTAASVVEDVTLNSPVGKSKKNYTGGRLKKAWEISQVSRVGNGNSFSRSITVSNSTHYAIHVEFGHRTRLGKGKKASKLGGKPYVEGQFFLSNAIEKAFRKIDLKI
ncbi:MAG: HK97 gp10 family phage protein, partial [Cetobacterium sp.]